MERKNLCMMFFTDGKALVFCGGGGAPETCSCYHRLNELYVDCMYYAHGACVSKSARKSPRVFREASEDEAEIITTIGVAAPITATGKRNLTDRERNYYMGKAGKIASDFMESVAKLCGVPEKPPAEPDVIEMSKNLPHRQQVKDLTERLMDVAVLANNFKQDYHKYDCEAERIRLRLAQLAEDAQGGGHPRPDPKPDAGGME